MLAIFKNKNTLFNWFPWTTRNKCTMFSWEQQSCNIRTSRKVVIGTPFFSRSMRTFFKATISFVFLSRALYTTPYVPSPMRPSFSYAESDFGVPPNEGGVGASSVSSLPSSMRILFTPKGSLPPFFHVILCRVRLRARCCCLRASPACVLTHSLRAWDVLLLYSIPFSFSFFFVGRNEGDNF